MPLQEAGLRGDELHTSEQHDEEETSEGKSASLGGVLHGDECG